MKAHWVNFQCWSEIWTEKEFAEFETSDTQT